MNRNQRIICMLGDAQRDMRLKPSNLLKNQDGLCHYFQHHDLMASFQYKTKVSYIKEILGRKYDEWYTFCKRESQNIVHAYPEVYKHVKYDRSKFCAKRKAEFEAS